MRGSASDLVFTAGAGDGLRFLVAAALLAAAVALCPNLEDVSLLTLGLLALLSASATVGGALGAAWIFDAADFDHALARADRMAGVVFGSLIALFAVLWFCCAEGDGWRIFPCFIASWCLLAGELWAWLGRLLSPSRRPPDLKRWLVRPEARREERRPVAPIPEGVEAVLVESGSFRVDRERMLAKLAEYQLPDASHFLVPWLRLAVASEAARLRLDTDGPTLAFSFDGHPLLGGFLRDPWAALTGEGGPGSSRHRQLAYGLLALLRLEPRAVRGWSGEGSLRAALRIDAPGELPLDEADPGGGTVLKVRFPGPGGPLKVKEAVAAARLRWGLADATLVVDGVEVRSPEAGGEGGLRCQMNGFRIVLSAPPMKESIAGSLRCYHLGALVCEVEGHWAIKQGIVASVSHPKFRLNASQDDIAGNKFKEDAGKAAAKARAGHVLRGPLQPGERGRARALRQVDARPPSRRAQSLPGLGFPARRFHARRGMIP